MPVCRKIPDQAFHVCPCRCTGFILVAIFNTTLLVNVALLDTLRPRPTAVDNNRIYGTSALHGVAWDTWMVSGCHV